MNPQELAAKVGETIGTSEWVEMSQERINQFAEATGDHQFIHVNEEMAKMTPFGGTIAHGALVQILQSRMQLNLGYEITGFSNMVNYGSDRLRFPSPVPAGATIHSRARVKRVEQVKSGTQLTLELNTHVLGNERPSVINELVILYM